jgi:hypothetical protein
VLGMPLDAWVLLFCAVGLGLTLELRFYLGRRRDRSPADVGIPDVAPPGGGGEHGTGGTNTAPGEDPGEPAPGGARGDAGGAP